MKTYQFVILAVLLSVIAALAAGTYFKRPRPILADSTAADLPPLEPVE